MPCGINFSVVGNPLGLKCALFKLEFEKGARGNDATFRLHS
jgi:hypothetical protein